MRVRLAVSLGSFVLLSACRFHPAPVPLVGHAASIADIAGEWNGSYTGTDTRRSGRIWFRVVRDADSAFGEVRMDAFDPLLVVVAADDPRTHQTHARAPQFLAIRFVAVLGGEVGGQLEPYRAPDCSCVVTTYFSGRVRGDTISGTFQTKLPGVALQSGTWTVVRSQPE